MRLFPSLALFSIADLLVSLEKGQAPVLLMQ